MSSRVRSGTAPLRTAWGALVAASALLLAGCGGSDPGAPGGSEPVVVRIAAASDLKFALDEIAADFEAANPDVDVQPTYGSSGVFVQQITEGAPFDLYLSADIALAEQLAADGLAAPEDVFEYAVGRLVVWAPNDSPVDPTAGLAALATPEASRVAIANPDHAPYGRAAVAALESAGLSSQVRDKLVLGENIAQTAEFVASGNAQVGVIALSLALAPELSGSGRYVEVPLESFPRLDQGGVVLAGSRSFDQARAVQEYLTGDAGLKTLKRYGFFLPGE